MNQSVNERNKPMSKQTEIFTDLMLIIERDSDAVYDILEVLISLLNDKLLREFDNDSYYFFN